MRLTILLFTIVVLAACAGGKNHRHSNVQITEATSQGWAGGAVGSGFGTNYEIKVQYTGSAEIQFDTLWVGGRAFMPYAAKQGEDAYLLKSKYTSRPMRDPQTGQVDETRYVEMPPKSENAPEFEGEGMLIYRVAGERYWQIIERFEKLEQLNYP